MHSKRIVQTFVAVAIAGGLSLAAHAQIGSGWTSTNETFKVQTSGCGSVNGNTFSISCSSSGTTKDRAEREYNAWSSGTHQFQGDCTITSFGGDGICIKQTFQENSGPWDMLAAKSSGSIYEVSNGKTIGSFTVGSSFRVNTILDASHGTVDVYFNGVYKETLTGGTTPIYDKCGTYRLDSGNGPITATWNNVQFWYGGTTNSGGGGGFSGWYQIIDHNSGKNANVKGAATTNGAVVQLYTTGTASNEEWEMTPTDSGYYQIVNRNSGKVMAVQGASTSDGAAVIQWSFGSSQNDQWKPVSVSGGYYNLQNRHSGLLLDVKGGATTNGTPFQQYHSTGGNNQQFQFVSQP